MNSDAIQTMVEYFHPILRNNILKLLTEKLGMWTYPHFKLITTFATT